MAGYIESFRLIWADDTEGRTEYGLECSPIGRANCSEDAGCECLCHDPEEFAEKVGGYPKTTREMAAWHVRFWEERLGADAIANLREALST